jgi:hypothetical protein
LVIVDDEVVENELLEELGLQTEARMKFLFDLKFCLGHH